MLLWPWYNRYMLYNNIIMLLAKKIHKNNNPRESEKKNSYK
jgi:hypothetical protein